ncbi:hypothetical protein TeGR_g11821 [Tetraparma gracilis]|uniref:V-type proton ATPase subunit F n=1 Tax=Tetraparma gracilis TaxID=2962635 RepID=A0ABQ6M7T4_9STRA|nr:hypothetical protein TeGR_g11821 [Tetraparma gracilis]
MMLAGPSGAPSSPPSPPRHPHAPRPRAGERGRSPAENGKLVAVIGDDDTVTGFLLAGCGHRTSDFCNFLVVDSRTSASTVEATFRMLAARDDVGIILINQHVASTVRGLLRDYSQTIPTVLEIPAKDHPYDPDEDFIMQRVNMYLGGGDA